MWYRGSPHNTISYSQTKKYPPDRDFLMQNSTVFGYFLKKYSEFKNVIYLIWKLWYPASMSQKLKGRGQPIWWLHPLEWNSNFFHLRGPGYHMNWPRPSTVWLKGTVYQGFQMRYITFLYDNWFLRYKPSKLNDRKKNRFTKEISPFFRSFNFDGSYLKNQ